MTILGVMRIVAGVAVLAYTAFEWLVLRWGEVGIALDETRDTYL